jgi:hypothetical protein
MKLFSMASPKFSIFFLDNEVQHIEDANVYAIGST